MRHSLKAKTVITTALSLGEFWRVSYYDTAKEMWVILQIKREETEGVNKEVFSTLTHKYELFRMKSEENSTQMQTRFTHILSHMKKIWKQHFQMRN